VQERISRLVCAFQGSYFVATGVWPLVHLRSFLALTGPKTDLWLVQSFGLLVASVGVALLRAWVKRTPEASLPVGACTAAAMVMADGIAARAVSPIYLIDMAPELLFLVGWLLVLRRQPGA